MSKNYIAPLVAVLAVSTALVAPAQAETLRIASQGDATSLDPHSHNESFTNYFLANVYEGLVARDEDFEIAGQLAQSWEQVDATTWRFTLRDGVSFHDGSAFAADDVIFSMDRALSETSNFKHVLASVESYSAIDDMTVEVVTKAPNPILLNDLLDLMILDKQWADANGAAEPINLQAEEKAYSATNANGTGPFQVVSRAQGEKTTLAAFDGYWGDAGNVTEVVFTPINNAATLVSALLSGEVDLVMPLPLQDIPRVENGAGVKVVSSAEARTMYIGMDQWRDQIIESPVEGNPFLDLRVRQAIAHAVDAQAIIDRVMQGQATLATQYVMDKVNGYNPDLTRLEYSVDTAKSLLAEAGYPDGFEVTMDCSTDRYVNDGQICQATVSLLARVGIKVNLIAQPKAQFFPKVVAPDFGTSFFLLSWTPSTMDALNVFQNVLGTRDLENGKGAWNISGCSVPEADALAAEAAVTMDATAREKMLQDAMALMVEDVCLVPLHVQQLVWGAAENIDVVQHPTFEFPLEYFNVN
ncbi:ABC transporter substrate-binding protein [Marinovum sp. 2_MG-2023]|uniref:ABC transporter substrate-binding protein n=1 Tax=unclassified Marinovum TaxID=2647166 RepID=UPI0026E37D8B|nr:MULTISPECIES: ABC transporter substrate-binding protein [unclassified Marinovum]MDO6730042.1 ABC transporter substrate-binding protein [Marinovum sp. 2_MG-2023]MDO6779856.1 ABC transporter substrate-binding protein [Marinovum sp. 1_MG-2023]